MYRIHIRSLIKNISSINNQPHQIVFYILWSKYFNWKVLGKLSMEGYISTIYLSTYFSKYFENFAQDCTLFYGIGYIISSIKHIFLPSHKPRFSRESYCTWIFLVVCLRTINHSIYFSDMFCTINMEINSNIYNRLSYFNNKPQILSHIMIHRLQWKRLDNKIFTEQQSKYLCLCTREADWKLQDMAE